MIKKKKKKKKIKRKTTRLENEDKDEKQEMENFLSVLEREGFQIISEKPTETYVEHIIDDPARIEFQHAELNLPANLSSDYELTASLTELLNKTDIVKNYRLDNNITEANAFLFRYNSGGRSNGSSSNLEIVLNKAFAGLRLILPASIARILGFPLTDGQVLLFPHVGTYVYMHRKLDITANRPPFFYVYCNLVEPSLVGDTLAPILRSVILPRDLVDSDQYVSKAFNPVNYYRLSQTSFNSIEIELRTQTGGKVPFIYGIVNLVLHVRAVSVGERFQNSI